jgi:cytochrome P450
MSEIAAGLETFDRVDGLLSLRYAAALASDPIRAMQQVYSRHGRLIEFRPPLHRTIGIRRFVFAVGPRFNQAVFNNPAVFRSSGLMLKGPRASAQRRVRHGLVTMNGAQHAHYRKLIQPSLRRARMDGLASAIAAVVDAELGNWPVGQKVDLWALCRRLAQRASLAVLFQSSGCAALAEAEQSTDLINRHLTMGALATVRGCPINVPYLPYSRYLQHAERTEAQLVRWAKGREGRTDSEDMISLVLNTLNEIGQPISDGAIGGHVFTLLAATYETCQSVLTWLLFMLAQHPRASASLLDETENLSLEGADLVERMERCTWLDAVVKEAMRILPPVPMQIRAAIQDTALDGCVVEKQTRVILSPFLTNRLPELYPDADRFLPERWQTIDPNQFEYLVFSAGPRTCPGYRFATNFLKVTLTQIIRRFRISIVERAQVDYRVTITTIPRRSIPAIIYPQDRNFAASPVTGNIRNLVRFDAERSRYRSGGKID